MEGEANKSNNIIHQNKNNINMNISRRNLLAGCGFAAVGSTAGCLSYLPDEDIDLESESVNINEEIVDKLDYKKYGTDTITVDISIDALGADTDIHIKGYKTIYTREDSLIESTSSRNTTKTSNENPFEKPINPINSHLIISTRPEITNAIEELDEEIEENTTEQEDEVVDLAESMDPENYIPDSFEEPIGGELTDVTTLDESLQLAIKGEQLELRVLEGTIKADHDENKEEVTTRIYTTQFEYGKMGVEIIAIDPDTIDEKHNLMTLMEYIEL